MDSVARDYVRLALALGRHDPSYVDAYYGPPEWKAEASGSLAEIRERATQARATLAAEPSSPRKAALEKALGALIAKAALLAGETMAFDEESLALYDVVAPARDDAYYAGVVAELQSLLPGDGPPGERLDRLRARHTIPPDRLTEVFRVAIEAARAETRRHIDLPEGESFRTEYVTGRVWGAYNWYEGDAHSLIQVNTDLPTPIDAPLHLACHEGYPGHHVYNALLERRLARERGWVEFTVYPLYGPQSLIAEGTAEYGYELAFPPEARRVFERETLYPLAGLDPGGADEYARAVELAHRLGTASNDAGRRLLDGEATREETVAWFVEHALLNPQRAEQRVRFIEAHRSYVVTYNVGLDLVRDHVESRASGQARWGVFTELLSTPQTPSGLAV